MADKNMKFRAHDTFFIRKGWLSKGIRKVSVDKDVFKSTNDNPMDVLGIGANMVKALRYWMQAVCLTEEKDRNKSQIFTDIGKIIKNYDPYIEEIGTLWLLHYNLASNKELATAWYYFFNEFNASEFTKEEFVNKLDNFARLNGVNIALRSLEDDFNCIINTYAPRSALNPGKINPENNIDSPFGELGLVSVYDKKNGVFRKRAPRVSSIPTLIAFAVLVKQSKGKDELQISSVLSDSISLGKCFNLDVIGLNEILNSMEKKGLIRVIRTAGLDVVKIVKKINFNDCIKQYYEEISKGF